MDLQAELKGGQWRMNSQKWILEKGSIAGGLKLESNQDISTGQIAISLDDYRPSPEISKFMEILNPQIILQGKLNAQWKKSVLQSLTLQIKADALETKNFGMQKPVMNLKKSPLSNELKVQAVELQIHELPISNGQANGLFPVTSKNMSAIFQWDLDQEMKWNMSSSLLKSSGSSDSQGVLKGSLSVGPKTLNVSGTLSKPQLLLR